MVDQNKINEVTKAAWATMINANIETIQELAIQMPQFIEALIEQKAAYNKVEKLMFNGEKR